MEPPARSKPPSGITSTFASPAAYSPACHTADSLLAASIRLPDTAPGAEPDRVVRPALALLFRIAVGPSADRYVRRFLAFERNGHGAPGWHWPSLLLPAAWAFYRKLWLTGTVFALLPLAGALAFVALTPQFEHADAMWVLAALGAIWVVPGVVAALCADSLLYAHVRALVRGAERSAKNATDAMQQVAELRPTSATAGVLLGGGALVLVAVLVLPHLQAAYKETGVRAQLAQTLHALRYLEHEIESSWTYARLVPRQSDHAVVRAQPGAALIADLEVDPISGRVRLGLSSGVPELAGRTILLAPRRDAQDNWQWMCVPVDIPVRYLPKDCRA